MTPEDKLRYIKMATIPEMKTILQALAAWKNFEPYYIPEFNEEAALEDPEFATLIEKIWQAAYRSATHNEKGLNLEEVVFDPGIALRASTQYKLATFLPECTSYEDFRQKANERFGTFHQTHPHALLHLAGLDWNIPFTVTKQRISSTHSGPPQQQGQAAEADSMTKLMTVAATDGIRSILRAIKEGKQYFEKYYPEGKPFMAEDASKDTEFLEFLHRLVGSINRSLGRDPSTKDLRSHGASTIDTLDRNIVRSVHFRLSQIVPLAVSRPDFERYVELTIPNYGTSITKLFTLGGFNWDIRFPYGEKEKDMPAEEAKSLFETAAETPSAKAPSPEPGTQSDLLPQIKEATQELTEELATTKSGLEKAQQELAQLRKALTIVIAKSAVWNKPLTNEEITLIGKFLG